MSLHRRSLVVLAVDLGSSVLSLILDAEHAVRRAVREHRTRATRIDDTMRRHPAGGRPTPPPTVPDQPTPADADDAMTPGQLAARDQVACWARREFATYPVWVAAEVTALEHQYGGHPLWDDIEQAARALGLLEGGDAR